MLRSEESNVLELALELPITKKSTYFDRVNFGCTKKDPFEGKVDSEVWFVKGNKLLRKVEKESKE